MCGVLAALFFFLSAYNCLVIYFSHFVVAFGNLTLPLGQPSIVFLHVNGECDWSDWILANKHKQTTSKLAGVFVAVFNVFAVVVLVLVWILGFWY